MNHERVYAMPFSSVYPLLVKKVERKGRTRAEVDAAVCWLTGYDQAGLEAQIERGVDYATFFREAPTPNPHADKITGVICGHRVEDIEEPLMRDIRRLDKLVDEIARGKALDKVLRS